MSDIKVNFTEWFKNNLKVDRFPVYNEIHHPNAIHADVDVFINVSDELYFDFANAIVKLGKQHYYFPMGEMSEDMGISSLYGALEVLYNSYLRDRRVLLHCQAGRNRSPTVQCAFYYMMTGEHIAEEITEGGIYLKSNQLFYNAGKYLPNLIWLELWLQKCRLVFEETEKFLGGKYDFTIETTNKACYGIQSNHKDSTIKQLMPNTITQLNSIV